jgi:hypothetical protein
MPKLTRKTAILIKLESSYGTDPTPTGAANYLEVTELSAEPVVSDEVNREVIRPYLGNSEVLLANTRVNLNFTVEMVGSGTAGTAAKWDAAILSCGTSKTVVSSTSVTYAPESTTTWDSCTIWYYTDGVRHQAKGCRGTFSINCEVGQIPTISFSMTGIYVAPTDTAIPSVTKSNQAPPVIFTNGNTSAVSLMGWTGAAIQSWSFDMNNATTYRELVGGTKEVLITERTPSGSVVVEAPALSAHNFFTDATGSSTGTNTWQHSGGAGNIITVSCPQSDLGAPSYSDSDGIVMLNLPFMATPTSAGNNEFSLVCT